MIMLAENAAYADTFVNKKTGDKIIGFCKIDIVDGNSTLVTPDKGDIQIKKNQWNITTDRNGRNPKAIVVGLNGDIMHEISIKAMSDAITHAVDQGPYFILLELDTPGGRTDLAQNLCNTIKNIQNTPVVCFIKGDNHGGAISAGAAVALSCDKIYISPNAVIGAATMLTIGEKGPASLKKAYGEEIGEKLNSLWRAFLAGLAESNGRPGLLARAMVEKDIEVVEIENGNQRIFIDPVNNIHNKSVIKTWSKKDSLLTLTAEEALGCGMADKIAINRTQVLEDMNAPSIQIVENTDWQDAEISLEKAKAKLDDLKKNLDMDFKLLSNETTRPRAMSRVRSIKADMKIVMVLAKRYPDLQIDLEQIQSQYNSVEAFYQKNKHIRRRSR